MSHVHLSRVNRGWVLRSHDHLSAHDVDAALHTVRSSGGGSVRWFVFEPTDAEIASAERHGLRADAPLLHMRCSLPLAADHRVAEGFVTRPFRPGVDNAAWLEVNARAFADHPEQGDWNEEVLVEQLAAPWFDAHGFLLHEREGSIAGFCWTQVHDHTVAHDHGRSDAHDHTHTAPVGEIYVIGVDPAFHGRGIGRSLTIAGFAHLAHRGLRQGMLYVAGDNTPAIALYESLGMTVVRRDHVFVGTIS